ncbi:hypothetical protein TRFO_29850 [Tritrichomonas foetus]|uniref:Uncharacterized protein n=1 Tax=Tritrichomonas foetus TaxID=1144522 RepID=A0A1J4JZJ3_9EUKA|nr:hypothetical protein TRFO_29850 [Tritrichomonas foetus]|eukprot:OHT02918.1 hypothetical protein TRFO_29850 [Tritrichomonas foetus]
MTTYLQCSCSSVRVKGEKVATLPPSLTNFRAHLDAHIPVFLISEGGITAVPKISTNRVCERCYDIVCNSCGSKFRIFIHGKRGYLQFPKKKVTEKPSNSDEMTVPLPLRSFIQVKETNSEDIQFDEFINSGDDDDFELMFSNSNENLVGSFHNASLTIHPPTLDI